MLITGICGPHPHELIENPLVISAIPDGRAAAHGHGPDGPRFLLWGLGLFLEVTVVAAARAGVVGHQVGSFVLRRRASNAKIVSDVEIARGVEPEYQKAHGCSVKPLPFDDADRPHPRHLL